MSIDYLGRKEERMEIFILKLSLYTFLGKLYRIYTGIKQSYTHLGTVLGIIKFFF